MSGAVVKCPYCKGEYDTIDHLDHVQSGDEFDVECGHCDKKFSVTYSLYYQVEASEVVDEKRNGNMP